DRALQKASRPDESELIARESRRRAVRRRRLVRRSVLGAGAAALLVGAWFGWQQLNHREAAEQIAHRAAELQGEVRKLNEEERTKTWGSVLLESDERLEKLELATLLATEALHRARTARTQQVLADLIAMSPWSDRALELELKSESPSLQFNADGTLLAAGGG